MNVPVTTLIYAVLLILLGVIGFGISGAVSVTALIPAFFGVVIFALGWLALRGKSRQHVMHAAALLGLVGFIFTIGSSAGLVTLMTGGQVARPGAVISKAIMSILSLAYVIICLLSFVIARLNRDQTR